MSLTTSGSNPQTLVTRWTNPITSLTLRSSSADQVLDDLRLTTSGSGGAGPRAPGLEKRIAPRGDEWLAGAPLSRASEAAAGMTS